MAESQEQFNKRAENAMKEIQVILDREKITLVATLDYTKGGIIPTIGCVSTEKEKPSPIQILKSKFIVP